MKLKFDFLKSPWSILTGIAAGIFIGTNYKETVEYIRPLGEIYISFLRMCIIPIISSAILLSVGKMMKSENISGYLRKMVISFALFLITVSLCAMLISIVSKPLTAPDLNTQRTIGKLMLNDQDDISEMNDGTVVKEIDTRYPPALAGESGAIEGFVKNMIPDNIFTALANGENLKIIFFFLIFGVMLKFVSDQAYDSIMNIFTGIYDAFGKVINLTLYFLPFGLFSLVAVQFSQIGFTLIGSLIKFVILFYITSIIVFFGASIIMWKYSGKPYLEQFRHLKDVIIICLGTRSSYTAMAWSIKGLVDGLKLDKSRVNLSVPLGITLARHGSTMTFTLAAMYSIQLYHSNIRAESIIIILLGSILASMASSGAPGLVEATMVELVLSPLGIPSGSIIMVLIVLNPILDPVFTLLNVYPNCAIAAIISNKKTNTEQSEETVDYCSVS